jgi:hypothetical protein
MHFYPSVVIAKVINEKQIKQKFSSDTMLLENKFDFLSLPFVSSTDLYSLFRNKFIVLSPLSL